MMLSTCRVRSTPCRKLLTSSSMLMLSTSTLRSRTFSCMPVSARRRQLVDQLPGLCNMRTAGGAENDRSDLRKPANVFQRLPCRQSATGKYGHRNQPTVTTGHQLLVGRGTSAHPEANLIDVGT